MKIDYYAKNNQQLENDDKTRYTSIGAFKYTRIQKPK